MLYCVDCRFWLDAQLHRTYVSPRCTQRSPNGDDCAYMRAHVCTLEGNLYEQKPIAEKLKPAETTGTP